MQNTRLLPEFTFSKERLEQLKATVPEAFADGKIQWETLREALGNFLEPDEATAEHFGLFWPGKRDARRVAALPSRATLLPSHEGVAEDRTKNLFIEGENLEVLKLLQKSYAGLVKMIFIDPPYNTGNDFIYNDHFTDPLREYLRKTGQADEQGALTTNTRADGRFHSNWLSMIYPRLRLARNLLRDDGAVFVTIDDNEVHNLRHVLNEVFGEECFITQIEWQKRYTRSNNTDNFTSVIDHILLYSRTPDFAPNLFPRGEEANNRYSNPDNDPRGPWKATPFLNQVAPEKRRNLCYPIKNPTTGQVTMPTKKAWRSERTVFDRLQAEGRFWWGKEGTSPVPDIKTFLSEVRQGMTPINFWSHEFAGHTDAANAEIKDLFGIKVFDTPKPTLLVQRMLEVVTNSGEDAIVMDFFAGSGTTAHAVLAKNRSDGGKRSFIMVQMPEATGRDDYKTISEIGKERIRRVIKKMNAEAQLKPGEDLGFKVFKLVESHLRGWQDYQGGDIDQLQMLFDEAQEPLIKGWTPDGVLAEIMLLEGFSLDSAVSEFPSDTNLIRIVTSDYCGHRLVVCLDKEIKESVVDGMVFESQDVFVCLDSALADQTKQRLSDRCTLKTI